MPRGAYAKSLGWSVGRLDWLNDPSSKVNRYWRVIEYGSAATDWPWIGRRVVGLWGPTAEPRGQLWGTVTDGFSTVRGDQKFAPFFSDIESDMLSAARRALWLFFAGGKRNLDMLEVRYLKADQRGTRRGHEYSVTRVRQSIFYYLLHYARLEDMPFVQGVIRREVEAGHFYRRALASFDPVEAEMDAIREVFSNIFGSGPGSVDPGSPAGLRKGRSMQAFDSYSRFGEVAPKKGRRRAERMSHSALMGGRYLVSVDATVNVQDFTRNARGQFTSLQAEVVAVNHRVATAFQDHVVDLMKRERRRPPTQALIRATADARNRTPGGSSVG